MQTPQRTHMNTPELKDNQSLNVHVDVIDPFFLLPYKVYGR